MKIVFRVSIIALLCACVGAFACDPAPKCTETKDCAAGQTCQDGTCQGNTEATGDGGTTESTPPKPCTEDKECEDSEYCKDKKCTALPAKCTKDEECRAGHTCDKASGKCFKKCSFDDDCPADQACDATKKQCIEVKKCKTADDCDSGQTCNTCRGICAPSVGQKCNEDFNCTELGGSDAAYCDKCIGECRKRLDTCSPCTKNEQCGQPGDLCLPDLLNPQSGKKFCGKACQGGTFCPSGYKCQEFKGDEYKDSPFQCIPASNNCSNPVECTSNADCRAQGKICDTTKGQCVTGCEVDENCPVDDLKIPCTSNADCTGKNSQAVCDAGTCKIQLKCCRGKCGRPCLATNECEAQELCTEGCCKVDGECRTSKDCGDKEYCNQDTGLCTSGCQTPDDCGTPDPQKPRCRWKCTNNQCVEDCSCRSPALDCTAIRLCPTKEQEAKDPLAPCRKPNSPACKPCSGNLECGCKPGEDCLNACTKKECQSDDECKGMPGGATSCYNGRCSTEKVCKKDSDCPGGERCENGFCAEACNNICVNLQDGPRCGTGCNINGDGSECPSRMPCTELLPQSGSGPKCKGSSKRCKDDSECSGDQGRCGEDGYCTSCKKGLICRNFNQMDPLDLVCIKVPPTVCVPGGASCQEGGF